MRTQLLCVILLAAACGGSTSADPYEDPTGVLGGSTSTGVDDESSTSGEPEPEDSSSSSGDGESSSSTGEALPTQEEPHGHCQGYDTCTDGRVCVASEGTDFGLASCTYACTVVEQCEPIPGHGVEPMCQVGVCLVPCDEAPCPSGFECHMPDFLNARPVCLAVAS